MLGNIFLLVREKMAYKVKVARWKRMLGNISLPVREKMAYKVKVARRKRVLGNISLPVREKMAYKVKVARVRADSVMTARLAQASNLTRLTGLPGWMHQKTAVSPPH